MTGELVAVIGGGPAGLGAAYGLVSNGLRPAVYEASERVGGLARSLELWGQRVDLGAHLLQRRDPRIGRIWDELVGSAYDAVPRRTAVLAGNKRFTYPYDPVDVARVLGPAGTTRCLASFAAAKLGRHDDENLEGWVVGRFGRRLFDLFVQDYAEKLFGLPARELDSAIAQTLVSFQQHASFVNVARARLRRRRRTGPKPMIVRPHGGVGALMDALARRISEGGGSIRCGAAVRRLEPSKKGVELETTSGSEDVAHVIITLPLPVVAGRLATAPNGSETRLRAMASRNLVLTYLLVDAGDLFRDQWLYLHSPTFRTGRVANFQNWSQRTGEGPAILAAEVWCDDSDEAWTGDDADIAAHTVHELEAAGLVRASSVIDAHVERVPRAFPILRVGDTGVLRSVARHFDSLPNVVFSARPDANVKVGVHQSVILGIEAAERVVARLRSD